MQMRDNFSLPGRCSVRPTGILIAALLIGCAKFKGQETAPNPAKTFDIVSVRRSDPKASFMMTIPELNNCQITNAPLKALIQFAYGLHDFQVVDAPDWSGSERFDIIAKMDPVSEEEVKAESKIDSHEVDRLIQERVQAVLADRFQLQVHRALKEMPIFELEVAKSGLKLRASQGEIGFSQRPGQLTGTNSSMESLASMLTDQLKRIVVDRTKLTGGYDFTLKWTPDGAPVNDTSPPGIFTAIQEQLGLKLTSAKGPVDVIVIDHVARPSDN